MSVVTIYRLIFFKGKPYKQHVLTSNSVGILFVKECCLFSNIPNSLKTYSVIIHRTYNLNLIELVAVCLY